MNQLSKYLVPPAYAGDAIGTLEPPASVVTETTQVGLLISNLIRAVIVVAGIYALLQFVLGGIGYISAGGDSQKAEAARNKITYSIIGLVIIAGSFIIIMIVSYILFGDAMAIIFPEFTTL